MAADGVGVVGGTSTGTDENVLLERSFELEAIDQALAAAANGGGSLTSIEAPAGLGKTALLQAATARANGHGMRPLTARGSLLEREFPFGVLRQLLEPSVAGASGEERERLFAGAAAFAEPLFALLTGKEHVEATEPDLAVLYGLYWLIHNVASNQPLLLAVDDCHWADEPSLRLVSFLVPRLADLPVAIMLGARPAEEHAENTLLAGIVTAPGVAALNPRPLSEQAVADLARALLDTDPEPDFVRSCHEVTAGNPFLLGVLLHELEAEGGKPTSHDVPRLRRLGLRTVSRTVRLRLTSVHRGAAALMRALAVLGDGTELWLAATLAGLDEREAGAAFDRLARAALLRRTARLEFVHPLVREAVYEDLGPTERSELHERAARLLVDCGASTERVAAQLLETTPNGESWVAETLETAGRAALARGTPEVAALLLGRALEENAGEPHRASLLLDLGVAEERAGRPEAEDSLRQAVAQASDPRTRHQAATALGRWLLFADRQDDALAVLEAAICDVPETDRELALRLEAEILVVGHTYLDAHRRVARRYDGLLERVAQGQTPGERLVLAHVAWERGIDGEPATKVVRLADAALAGGRLLEDEKPEQHSYFMAVNTLTLSDELERAEQLLGNAVADARERGAIRSFAQALWFRSWAAYRRGALREAEADAVDALRVATVDDWHLGFPICLALYIDCLLERGKVSTAAAELKRSAIEKRLNDSIMFDPLLLARARLLSAQGRFQQALNDIVECRRREEAWGVRHPGLVPWRAALARLLKADGKTEEALRLADEEVQLADAIGAGRASGMALRARALIGAKDQRVERLREAVGLLEASPARLEYARAVGSLGAALRREGHRTEARPLLRQALELARESGATVLADRIQTELQAAGGRPRSTIRTGLDALTPSERRVADLAAAGLSNAQIAQSLFVTPKTVETHLGSAYRKLAIRSRHELGGVIPASERRPFP